MRDRLGGAETESQARARIRAESCPPLLQRPDISLLTHPELSITLKPSGEPAPEGWDQPRSERAKLVENAEMSEMKVGTLAVVVLNA